MKAQAAVRAEPFIQQLSVIAHAGKEAKSEEPRSQIAVVPRALGDVVVTLLAVLGAASGAG